MNRIETINKIYDHQESIMDILKKYDDTVNTKNYQDKTLEIFNNFILDSEDMDMLRYHGEETNKLCAMLKDSEE